jgi:hypothetical protein
MSLKVYLAQRFVAFGDTYRGMVQYYRTLLLGGNYDRTTKDFGDAESP